MGNAAEGIRRGPTPAEEIAISKFKAKCLAVLERVRRTGRPIRVTRFGAPIADVHPPAPAERPDDWLGDMRDTGRILGDIVAPVADADDWEAARE